MSILKKWYVETDDKKINLELVAEFLNNEYSKFLNNENWTSKYFKWKISKINPNGKGYIAIAISNSRILGTLTISKRVLIHNDQFIDSFEIGDSYIKKGIYKYYKPENILENRNSYINKSFFGRMVNDLLIKVPKNCLVYGTPNNESKNGYIKNLNFQLYKNAKVSNFVSLSLSRIFSKFGLEKLILFLKKILLNITLKILRLKLSNKIENLDENLDLLKNENKFMISGYFDPAYFKYRFIDQPKKKYEFLIIKNTNNKPKGIVVYKINKTPKNKNICVIVDIFSNYNFFSKSLLIFRLFYQDIVFGYSFWGNEKYKFKMNINGFIKYDRVPIIFYNNDKYRDAVMNNKVTLDFKVSSFDVV